MSHTPFLLRPQQALSLFSGLAHSHTSKRGAPHLAQHIVAVEYASGSQEVHAQGASTRSRQRAKQATSTSELTGRAHRQKAPDASNLQRQHDHPYATATPKQSTKHTQHRRKGRDPWTGSDPELKSTRASIVKQLLRIETEGAFVGLVSGATTYAENQTEAGDEEDVALAKVRNGTFVVRNVVRWQRRLDFHISSVVKRPLDKLAPELHVILRLGVFEHLFSNSPAYTVKQQVQLTNALLNPGAGKMTNAVLRTLLRQNDAGELAQPPLPTSETPLPEAADQLGVATSHPTWIVLRWLHRWGLADTLACLTHNNRGVAQHCVRAVAERGMTPDDLLQKLQAAGVEASPSQALPHHFIKTAGLQMLLTQGLLQQGLCQVQDEAAGLVVALLDPQPGETILDACAAPGGKALYAASRMQGQGRLVAMDMSGPKLKALTAAVHSQGLQQVVQPLLQELQQYATWVAQQDEATQAQHMYDRVLLDAPCTGLGVLHKRADLRWRRTPEELIELVSLQEELLDAAAAVVKPGGLLVYSTCSTEPEENQDQISKFLTKHPHFQVEAASGPEVPRHLITPEGYFQSLPHKHDMDGAFGVRLRQAC